jgi:hypothetical protein
MTYSCARSHSSTLLPLCALLRFAHSIGLVTQHAFPLTLSFQVCSAFQRLAQSKHVWLAVVHYLGHRGMLSLPPRDTLLSYSATQLIQEVRRAVCGPWTWAATSSQAPALRRQIHVSMYGPSTSSACEPTLLFGDRHLLVKRGTGCEIWDIAENRPVWARDGVIRSQMVAQPVRNGTELFIALWSVRASMCVSGIWLSVSILDPSLYLGCLETLND